MKVASLLRLFYLSRLSQPAVDREVYRLMRRLRPASILELGMGEGLRTVRMLEVARLVSDGRPSRYSGIDLFEGRPAGQPGITLKEAHQRLAQTGDAIRLAPGDVHSALQRVSNAIKPVDLVVIGAGHAADQLERAWFYLPRVLHETTVVLRHEAVGGRAKFTPVSREQIERLAQQAAPQRRAA